MENSPLDISVPKTSNAAVCSASAAQPISPYTNGAKLTSIVPKMGLTVPLDASIRLATVSGA